MIEQLDVMNNQLEIFALIVLGICLIDLLALFVLMIITTYMEYKENK